VLECVINISEGRDQTLIAALIAAAGKGLLDVHRDGDHNRSVFTMAGRDAPGVAGDNAGIEADVHRLVLAAAGALDIRRHAGVHPRLGVIDVVPWVTLELDAEHCVRDGDSKPAIAARDRFARWAAAELALPCFLYGPPSPDPDLRRGPFGPDRRRDLSLPDVRRHAWHDLRPDIGPPEANPRLGAACVGARRVLVAYNLWLQTRDVATARRVAKAIRAPGVRTLGLAVGDATQVSCNLIDPWTVGPESAFDAVASQVDVARAELVGLLPRAVLDAIPARRWPELGLSPGSTIEARLQAGLDGGRFD
jgi:glutamate formiminotransferase